jgi:hypothetical protein
MLEVVWLHIHPLFRGDFRQCLPVVSKGSWVVIVFVALSCSILWRQVCILILTKNMKLRVDPFSRPYAKYLLKVSNGSESSIIDHFPLEVDAKPSIRVKIALSPKIH